MKQSSSELKRLAKGKLLGHYLIPLSAVSFTGILSILILFLEQNFVLRADENLVSLITCIGITFIMCLLMWILSAGNLKLFLNLARGKEYKFSDILYSFKNYPDHLIGIIFLIMLLAILCILPFLIFIVIGILLRNIVIYSLINALLVIVTIVAVFWLFLTYSQIIYIYLDQPEKKVLDILRESKRMMKGNKGRLFYLNISFLGLLLLSVFTFYIGLLWLYPYINTTTALFYLDLKNELPPADCGSSKERIQDLDLGNTFL